MGERDGLAVVAVGEKRVLGEEGLEREVRREAEVVAVDDHEAGLGPRRRAREELAGGDALPEIAEARPAGDAVHVGEDLHPGESLEAVPVELDLVLDEAVDAQSQRSSSMDGGPWASRTGHLRVRT